MSIYREIEDTDKVFGRVRKVSSGLFSTGFELSNFHLDIAEVSSKISGWVTTNTETSEFENNTPEIDETGIVSNFNGVEFIEEEQTLLNNSGRIL